MPQSLIVAHFSHYFRRICSRRISMNKGNQSMPAKGRILQGHLDIFIMRFFGQNNTVPPL